MNGYLTMISARSRSPARPRQKHDTLTYIPRLTYISIRELKKRQVALRDLPHSGHRIVVDVAESQTTARRVQSIVGLLKLLRLRAATERDR